MITFYAADKKGEVCKCEFIDMVHAMYGWLSLVSSDFSTYHLIKKSHYDKSRKKRRDRRPLYLFDAKKGYKIVGYYSVKQ